MNRILFILLFWLPIISLTAQDLRTSRNTSYYTYIYTLTAKQADKIYENSTAKIDQTYFTQITDSFPTGKAYLKTLPTGHYMYIHTFRNKLEMEVESVNNLSIRILNNNRDLSIMVHDFAGLIVTDAAIKLKHKTITYNPLTQTYLLPRTNRNGLLKVNYLGHTNYFQLKADHQYSKFKIATDQIVYRSPAKYVLIPVKMVVDIPYNTYRLCKYGRTYGIYYYLYKPVGDIIKSINYGNPYGYIEGLFRIFQPEAQNHKGYLVFNKPKYLPGDTVYFKAYIMNEKKRPIKDSLEVTLYKSQNKSLGWIKPYRAGAYKFQFIANKSLGLRLDQNYSVSLGKNYHSYMSGNFRYEEYELKSTKYDFRAGKDNCHYTDKVTFYCKGTDENDLILPDARVELTLLKQDILDYHSNRVFVPDTLWVHKQSLDPLGETKIIVPDSIFPAASVKIKVEARFLNSNNELQTQTISIVKDNNRKEIILKTVNDTVFINFHRNGLSVNATANLSIPGFIEKKEIALPYKAKINPFAESYNITTSDNLNKSITLSAENANVQCYSRRTADSIWFTVENPRNLPLTYTIFRKNSPVYRGNGSNTEFCCKNTTPQNYSASVQYVWGGEAHNEEYTIPFFDKLLTIKMFQPAVVYPGQKSKIILLVTDAYGKPVANADITALSGTKKFEQVQIPTLAYNGKNYPNRVLFNNFNTSDEFEQLEGTRLLDYKYWNPLLSLDTIERYKFLYPKDGYYQTTFKRTNTVIAEVSPYLVDSIGNLMPVNILYIDNEPVYYSITTNQKPYVFKVNEGWHSIKIRTTCKEISLFSIFLKKGTKTIICINPFKPNTNINVQKTTQWYTSEEQNLIQSSVFAIRNNLNKTFAFLKQGVNCEILKPESTYYNNNFIVGPYKQSNFTFQKHKLFTVNSAFEPGFEYEFLPSLLKMRTWNALYGRKNYPNYKIPAESFNDSVYTYNDVQDMLTQFIRNEQAVKPMYDNPQSTFARYGLLKIKYEPSKPERDLQPKNILVFSTNDLQFIRIYPGSETIIHDLKPGYYRLETLLYNDQLIITDSIEVKPFGTNYCRFTDANKKPISAYTDSINTIIQQRLIYGSGTVNYSQNAEYGQKRIIELAKRNRTITYTGGQTIRGIIFEDGTNEALPGVSIIVDGTTQGAVTDLQGEFSLSVPLGKYSITISYIGYRTKKMSFTQGADIRVALTPEIHALEEVVIVGYGTTNKRELTGSISVVHSDALQGRVAGMDVVFNSGGNPGIRIRGMATINSNTSSNTNELIKDLMQNKAFMNGVIQSKSIRNQFSDYAFWKPNLTTNQNGIASFDVTFPDDVTSWKTWYLAMGNKGACGQTAGEIKSFKPIMSSLAVPRFLVTGDHSNIIGKTLNYTDDSIQIESTFSINDSIKYKKNGKILASRIDTLTLTAPIADSLKLQYQIKKNDGYTDGELRNIPIIPLGTIETKGSFYNLDSDTTIALNIDKNLGKVTLHAESDIIKVLLEEMKHLRNYQHYCNEQLSSKLKALLWERKIYTLMKQKYEYDGHIRKIIGLLEERRNADSLWGWWQNGSTGWWITLHATEALKMAQTQGFTTNVDYAKIPPQLYISYHKMHYRDQMRAVKLLKIIDPVPSYQTLIDSIKIYKTDTVGRYELWELKQTCGIKFPLDSLKKEKKTTQFGNFYWGTEGYYLFDDAVSATLVAYRIIRNQNSNSRELFKIRNYLLERKGNMHWRNTWETCRILETILPDLISGKELNLKPELRFTGGYFNKVDTFPFKHELNPGETIYVTKKSKAPVYFTAYQQFFNPVPEKVSKDFIVNSHFENNDTNLIAGKPIKLIVTVTVKKASEYVLIEIPIPAGCSYQDKNNFVWGEDYREYYKEKVSIYYSRLGQNNYTFEVNLLPRYNGVYHLNPAKAELMYFPVFYGREGMKTVKID